MTGTTSTRPPPTWWGTTRWRSSPIWGTPAASSTISGASGPGRILEHFRAVLGGSKPTTGHTILHGWALRTILQNQLAAKFEVPSINNQSYFQHTIITLADSNFIHSFLHSFIHNSIIQSIICFLSLLIYHLYSNSFFRSIIHSFVRSFNHSSFYLSYLYSFLVSLLFSCSLLTHWLLAVHYIFTNSVEQSASSYGGFPSENVRKWKNLSGFIGHRTQLKRWPLVRSYYKYTIVTLADSNNQSYYQHASINTSRQ